MYCIVHIALQYWCVLSPAGGVLGISSLVPVGNAHMLSIYATSTGNRVLFHHQGGVEVGDVEAKAVREEVDIGDTLTQEQALRLVGGAPLPAHR